MDIILDFLKGFGDAIVTIFEFIVNFFGDLVFIIELTGKFLAQIPVYFSWLPAELLVLLGVIMAVVVIYKIMGREG